MKKIDNSFQARLDKTSQDMAIYMTFEELSAKLDAAGPREVLGYRLSKEDVENIWRNAILIKAEYESTGYPEF